MTRNRPDQSGGDLKGSVQGNTIYIILLNKDMVGRRPQPYLISPHPFLRKNVLLMLYVLMKNKF